MQRKFLQSESKSVALRQPGKGRPGFFGEVRQRDFQVGQDSPALRASEGAARDVEGGNRAKSCRAGPLKWQRDSGAGYPGALENHSEIPARHEPCGACEQAGKCQAIGRNQPETLPLTPAPAVTACKVRAVFDT